jgi:hypothetical protein
VFSDDNDDYDNDDDNNSIKFFIISVLHQQPEGQLQMQHKLAFWLLMQQQ